MGGARLRIALHLVPEKILVFATGKWNFCICTLYLKKGSCTWQKLYLKKSLWILENLLLLSMCFCGFLLYYEWQLWSYSHGKHSNFYIFCWNFRCTYIHPSGLNTRLYCCVKFLESVCDMPCIAYRSREKGGKICAQRPNFQFSADCKHIRYLTF